MRLYDLPYLGQVRGICSGCKKVVGVEKDSENSTVVAVGHFHRNYPCIGSGMSVAKYVNIPCWMCRKKRKGGNVPGKGRAAINLLCCKHDRIVYGPVPKEE